MGMLFQFKTDNQRVTRRNGPLYWLAFHLLLVMVICACDEVAMNLPPEVATVESSAMSPSGKYRLVIREQQAGSASSQHFSVESSTGELVFSSADQFLTQHTTYFLWDEHDRVWVYSGDLGTFFWEYSDSMHTWEKFVYAENDIPAPEFLKKMRPQWHKR